MKILISSHVFASLGRSDLVENDFPMGRRVHCPAPRDPARVAQAPRMGCMCRILKAVASPVPTTKSSSLIVLRHIASTYSGAPALIPEDH